MGMGIEIDELVESAKAFAAGVDPSSMTPREAESVLTSATVLRNVFDAVCVLVAPRATASGQWRRDGARTEAEWVGRKMGIGDRDASAALDTGRAAAAGELPATSEALREGRLSAGQAAAVASGASADPASEERLLDVAARESLTGLRRERDKVRAAAESDPEARLRRIHRSRYLRMWTDADGAGRGSWSVTPDVQAAIVAAVRLHADAAFEAARVAGERETSEAYAADGLAAMAAEAVHGSTPDDRKGTRVPPKAIVRIDHTALVRGRTQPGETSEVAGIGPVPVSVVREWMDSGDLFLTAVVTNGVDVATVAHLGRRPTAFQTTAMQWRDVTCRIQGCKRLPAEWDHHEDWADTKQTRLWDLGGLCKHHHDLKTNKGYRLVPTGGGGGEGERHADGKFRLVPPDDS